MATICMHHVLASLDALRRSGGDGDRLLAAAGINPGLTVDAQRRIHAVQVARLFKLVQLELNDEFMGFSATPSRVGAFRTMCDLVKHSDNLFELLEKAIDFYGILTDDVAMELEVVGGRAIFSIRHHSEALDPLHFLREFLLVIWHRFPSWYIGEAVRLRETHFSFPRPEHHGELQVMFPGALYYGRECNRLVFDAHYLDRPLVRSQGELEFFLRHAPADVMTIPGTDNSLERQIERVIESAGTGKLVFPRAGELADRLRLSPQTLYRQLRAAGTSYQKIKDDIRRETAIRRLVQDGWSVEEVSEALGYAEARSFTRAFRQWTGMSPRSYRKSVQASD